MCPWRVGSWGWASDDEAMNLTPNTFHTLCRRFGCKWKSRSIYKNTYGCIWCDGDAIFPCCFSPYPVWVWSLGSMTRSTFSA